MKKIYLALAASALVVSAMALVLYEHTRSSTASFCLKSFRFVSGNEKSALAITYADTVLAADGRRLYTRRKVPCCKVDKGGGDYPPLGVSDLLFGRVHLVHVPLSRASSLASASMKEVVIPVDSCGTPLSYGDDQ